MRAVRLELVSLVLVGLAAAAFAEGKGDAARAVQHGRSAAYRVKGRLGAAGKDISGAKVAVFGYGAIGKAAVETLKRAGALVTVVDARHRNLFHAEQQGGVRIVQGADTQAAGEQDAFVNATGMEIRGLKQARQAGRVVVQSPRPKAGRSLLNREELAGRVSQEAISTLAKSGARKVAVVSYGVVGKKVAEELRRHGVEVTVLVSEESPESLVRARRDGFRGQLVSRTSDLGAHDTIFDVSFGSHRLPQDAQRRTVLFHDPNQFAP